MKALLNIRAFILIVITVCIISVSVYVFALSVPHHGLNVDSTDVAACMSCHDGTIGKAVAFCTAGCDASTSHSIYKHYPPAGKRGEFNSIASVREQGLVIENDQVVCISCHDIRNQQPAHLAGNNNGSNLCLVCHVK